MGLEETLARILYFIAAALITVPISRRLGVGSVLGYLFAGILIGPSGLALITDVHDVMRVSEIGVMLLLFLIGLELQPRRLIALRHAIFVEGGAQLVLSALAIAALAWVLLDAWRTALVIGVALALSSTAFVLQMLVERRELNTRHGRAAFGILLLQDIAVIPALLLVALLGSGGMEGNWLLEVAEVLAVIAAALLGGRLLLRPLLRWVAATGIQELFTASALLLVFGAVLLMEHIGLSAGLGAFLAGVLVADSEFRHQLETDIEPFKGLLLGLFFIAVGMSVDLGLLLNSPLLVLGLAAALVLVKMVMLWPVARLADLRGASARSLMLVLSQGGEFAFVLFTAAANRGLLDEDTRALLVLVVTLSMMTTPLLMLLDGRLRAREEQGGERAFDTLPDDAAHDVVIAGFGRFGQIVGRLLSSAGVPFSAIDYSPREVDFVRRYGHAVYYGDPRRLDVLRAARLEQARVLFIAVDDLEGSIRIAEMARAHYPHLHIVARCRNRQHAFKLMDVGVEKVIRDTFHSALAAGSRVMESLALPGDLVDRAVTRFRDHDEALLREQYSFHQDDEALLQSAKDAAEELKRLFEADREPVSGDS